MEEALFKHVLVQHCHSGFAFGVLPADGFLLLNSSLHLADFCSCVPFSRCKPLELRHPGFVSLFWVIDQTDESPWCGSICPSGPRQATCPSGPLLSHSLSWVSTNCLPCSARINIPDAGLFFSLPFWYCYSACLSFVTHTNVSHS